MLTHGGAWPSALVVGVMASRSDSSKCGRKRFYGILRSSDSGEENDSPKSSREILALESDSEAGSPCPRISAQQNTFQTMKIESTPTKPLKLSHGTLSSVQDSPKLKRALFGPKGAKRRPVIASESDTDNEPSDSTATSESGLQEVEKLMEMFPGRIDLAIAGYNSGPYKSAYKQSLKNKTPFTSLKGKIPNESYTYASSILQP